VRRRVELAADGRLLSRQPIDLATPEERAGPKRVVPDLTRTSGVAALAITDKASYVFGPGPATKCKKADCLCQSRQEDGYVPGQLKDCPAWRKAGDEHAAYVELLDDCIARAHDKLVEAVRTFTANEAYEQLEVPDDWDDDDVVEFSVGGRDPLSSPEVRSWWAERAVADTVSSQIGQCMVCGRRAPLVEKFPQLKGIPGAQTSGSPLVSFNKDAHEHYGLSRSLNAHMCSRCATASHGALAVLLQDERHSRKVGPFRWVWWALGNDEVHLDTLLFEADPAEVAALLRSPLTGQPLSNLGTERFLAVALGGNSGRAVVRAWVDTALAEAQANLSKWFTSQAVVGRDGAAPRPLALWELLAAAAPAPGKDRATSDDAARRLLPRLVESALLGHHVPVALWQGAIGRIRATGDVTQAQASALKLALLPDNDQRREVTMTSLQPDRAEPAYHCGRLLSVLDQTQRAAVGRVNSTVVDRFYGSASSSPSTSMPALVRAAQAHLAKLRKKRPGWAVAYERKLTEIIDRLEQLPHQLTMQQQAEFALGFYHQRASDIAEAKAAKAKGVADAPPTEEDIPETEED
jgi:CRISPR-associated protein Csd1